MSRILEALRRAEQEHGAPAAPPTAEDDLASLPELLRALQPKAVAPNRFPASHYRPSLEHLLATDGHDRTAQAESFRVLRFRLEAWRGREPRKIVLIASSIPKDGKTVVAVNLARTLALTGARVLLIDADLRKGGIHDLLEFKPDQGLAEVLQGNESWQGVCREVAPLGFCYLAAGRLPANPAELLRSQRLRQTLQEAATIFDWIVVDSPPLVPFADARYLAALAHGVVLVARDGWTPLPELTKSLQALASYPLVGLVMNDSDEEPSSGYYARYPLMAAAPMEESARA